jgi:hypothetical protein
MLFLTSLKFLMKPVQIATGIDLMLRNSHRQYKEQFAVYKVDKTNQSCELF